MRIASEEIRLWMRDNFLKLNDSKTEYLIIGSKHHTSKTAIDDIVLTRTT